VDPLASKFPNQNSYNYVENNPLVYIDPDGKQKFPTGKSVVNDIKRQFISSFDKNVVEPIEEVNEVALEITHKGTETYAAVADETSQGLVIGTGIAVMAQPELAEFAPATLAAAGIIKGTSVTAKSVNYISGGGAFSKTDILSDLLSVAFGVLGGDAISRIIMSTLGELEDTIVDAANEENSDDVKQKDKEKEDE